MLWLNTHQALTLNSIDRRQNPPLCSVWVVNPYPVV
ncbi:hypothetical protein KEN51_CDS0369 [Pseudomonas phage vB_Pae10145-KEN51]|nr:hypothetical protein [Pseudomonas phage ANB1]